MFQAIKDERERKKRIKELNALIEKTVYEEVSMAKDKDHEEEAYARAFSMLKRECNVRDSLRQQPWLNLLRKEGILVPSEHWQERHEHLTPVLNESGEIWVRGEYRRLWKLNIEFWFKIVVPILALILAIIFLMKIG